MLEDDRPFIVYRQEASAFPGDEADDIGARIAEAFEDSDNSASAPRVEERPAVDAKQIYAGVLVGHTFTVVSGAIAAFIG